MGYSATVKDGQMQVQVPVHFGEGTRFFVQIPDGSQVMTVVPPGIKAGDTIPVVSASTGLIVPPPVSVQTPAPEPAAAVPKPAPLSPPEPAPLPPKPKPAAPAPPPKQQPVVPAQIPTRPIFPAMPDAVPLPLPSLEEAMARVTGLMEATKAEAVAASERGDKSAERLSQLRRQGSAARLAAVLVNQGDITGALALLDPFSSAESSTFDPPPRISSSIDATLEATLPKPRALAAIEMAAKTGAANWL